MIITLFLFIWGINYLKGIDIFSKQVRFHVLYDDTGGLLESNPVSVSGVRIGQVESISLHPDGSGKVVVTAIADRQIRIPVNSVAVVEGGIIGDREIRVLLGDSPEMISSGDTLSGRLSPGITEIFLEQIIPLRKYAESLIQRADSVFHGLNMALNPDNIERIDNILADMEMTISALESISSSAERTIGPELERLPAIIDSAETISSDIAGAGIKEAILKTRETAEALSLVVKSLEMGEGTAGLMLKDEELYNNLNKTLGRMDSLLLDIQENPSRYFNISVFGR